MKIIYYKDYVVCVICPLTLVSKFMWVIFVMLQGKPVNQRKYAARYNPVRGRRSIEDINGPFKIVARTLGLGSALGYDPKGESGFLVNNTVKRQFDGMQKVAFFLKKFKDTPLNQIKITQENGKKYLVIGKNDEFKHRFFKRGDVFYLVVKKDYRPQSKNKLNNALPIKIHADNHDEFKEKVSWILSKPVSQAKLDYHVPRLILPSTDDIKRSGYGKYVYFNENKVIGDVELQEFTDIGDPGDLSAFNSEVGGSDPHQVNYFGPRVSYRGYSYLKDPEKPVKKVHDRFGARVHAVTEHILSSSNVDELLGNIINMHARGKVITPEHRAQMIQDIREDFVYNLYGKGSRNGLGNQESNDQYTPASKFQNFLSQFLLTSDPLRGGRVWRPTSPVLRQVIALMYRPKGDGSIVSLYEKDPEKYLKNMRSLKITMGDRQFVGSYGRKILGVYIALKLIKDEMSKINLNYKDTSSPEHKKWHDLNKLHDELFESAGDLKDFLRYHSTGFVQISDTVQKEIPKVKYSTCIDNRKPVTRESYKKLIDKTIYPLVINFAQFENFMGWHPRERGSSILYNTLKTQIFDREISDIVAGSATVMLIKGLDKVSRRLRFIQETVGRDADLKGVCDQVYEKAMRGDVEGAVTLFSRQMKRMSHVFRFDKLYPGKKLQAFQTEGNLWEKEVYMPIIANYQSENQNFYIGNHVPVDIVEENGMILTAKLTEAIKLQARLIQEMHQEVKQNNLKSPYESKTMVKIADYMHSAAVQMADDFMKQYASYFTGLTEHEREKIKDDIRKEMITLQELLCNVSGILANGEMNSTNQILSGVKKRVSERNQKLGAMVRHKAPMRHDVNKV